MLRKLFLSILIFSTLLFAQEKKIRKEVNEFLIAGPAKVTLPALYNEGENKFEVNDLLKFDHNNVTKWWVGEGDEVKWKQDNIKWERVNNNEVNLESGDDINLYYAGFYIEVNRYIQAELEIKSCQLLRVWLDGNQIGMKTNLNETKSGGCEPGSVSSTVKLETGKHFVLIKTINDPSGKDEWTISASITYDKKYENDLKLSVNPIRTYGISDVLDNKKVESFSLSYNGETAALKMKERNSKNDAYDEWIELRKVSDASLIWTFRGGMQISEVNWSNKSDKFAYTTTSGETKSLWVVDLKQGTTEPLLEKVKNMGGFEWAPDDSYIVYTVKEEAKDDEPNFKKYKLPEDRWPGFRDKEFIYRVFIDSKTTERLTAGEESTSLAEISPDSKKILYTKTYYGQYKRPYHRTDYFILNLENMEVDSITSLYYSTGVSWSPNGNKLLFLGGATTFGDIGVNVDQGVIPNDYDTQAYIYDIESGNVDGITKEFKPSISSAYWNEKSNNVIYFSASDQSYQYLYKYNTDNKSYEKIDLGVEVLDEIDFSKDFSTAIFKGSSSNIHYKLYKYDVVNRNVDLFIDTEAEEYEDIELGEVKDWDFISGAGQKIKGRIYYPPNFDENKKYPAIVYYYGGTSPVERSFEGRYPLNYWAANGYVVYVLQPSGATGFGQEFSAKHVNDWGTTTAQEIIEGTEKFVEAHKFVGPGKLGCIGASYGGFMTMNLIAKTDMFSAAISHAGISNLASYWGVGYWGYWYNSIAAAESFPWNSKDVYVDKSPLYNADKVNTPLLLLHGSTDPNVPPGESMQMFVALKHLGKDVTLIEVDKQEHWILEYDKRKKWSKTIVAYFDKYLKDQPEWFESIEY